MSDMHGFNVFGYKVESDYTQKLSKYVSDLKFEDLPSEVVERAKFITLHTIGCSLAATPIELTKSAEKVAQAIGGGGKGVATSWISGQKLSPPAAGFVNGTAADMLDWEDCSYTGHPSAVLVPAAIALAEEQKANGRDYMTAFVAGFEVYQRIALCVGWPELDLDVKKGHALPNWPIFAASVAAAKYYGFDDDKVNQTIGMTVLFHKQTSNLQQATMSDAYHYEHGMDTQNGILAALCVREGVSNLRDCLDIPYAYVEHQTQKPLFEWLTKQLGDRHLMMEMLLKHWPTNMWIQTPVEIAYDLARDNNINVEEIKEIIVDPPVDFRMHFRPEGYDSLMDAEFSIPYCIAACLLEDKPGPNWYSEENFKNPKLLNLASKVHCGESKLAGNPFFTFYESNGKTLPDRTITYIMNDGTKYERTQALHKGHPGMMFTRNEIHELFMHQCSYAISKEKAQGLFDFIMDLENQEDISLIGQFFEK